MPSFRSGSVSAPRVFLKPAKSNDEVRFAKRLKVKVRAHTASARDECLLSTNNIWTAFRAGKVRERAEMNNYM